MLLNNGKVFRAKDVRILVNRGANLEDFLQTYGFENEEVLRHMLELLFRHDCKTIDQLVSKMKKNRGGNKKGKDKTICVTDLSVSNIVPLSEEVSLSDVQAMALCSNYDSRKDIKISYSANATKVMNQQNEESNEKLPVSKDIDENEAGEAENEATAVEDTVSQNIISEIETKKSALREEIDTHRREISKIESMIKALQRNNRESCELLEEIRNKLLSYEELIKTYHNKSRKLAASILKDRETITIKSSEKASMLSELNRKESELKKLESVKTVFVGKKSDGDEEFDYYTDDIELARVDIANKINDFMSDDEMSPLLEEFNYKLLIKIASAVLVIETVKESQQEVRLIHSSENADVISAIELLTGMEVSKM